MAQRNHPLTAIKRLLWPFKRVSVRTSAGNTSMFPSSQMVTPIRHSCAVKAATDWCSSCIGANSAPPSRWRPWSLRSKEVRKMSSEHRGGTPQTQQGNPRQQRVDVVAPQPQVRVTRLQPQRTDPRPRDSRKPPPNR